MKVADYLFPSDLSMTETPIRRVLVAGSCMAAGYVTFLHSMGVAADYVTVNGFAEPLPPPSPMTEYDFQIVQLALRDIVTDRVIAFPRYADDAYRQDILESSEDSLRLRLAAYLKASREFGILTFVCNFFVPQRPVAASLTDAGGGRDFNALVRRLNDVLAEVVAEYPNAYVSDIDAIASSIGKSHMQDDVVHFFSHNCSWSDVVGVFDTSPDYNAPREGRIEPIPPIGEIYTLREPDFLEAVWRQWLSIYRTVNQIDQVKLVIFDLDDTLWRGQIAEHYGEGGWPAPHGWPFGIWETVHHLKARGILTAICSKNEESLVRERWSRAVCDNWVTLDDFTFAEINWRPKAENIAKIIQQAGITSKSVVFVDDNPVERAAVKAVFPDIRLLGSTPYVTRRILLWSPETQVARLTEESINRDAMVRQQQIREREKESMSREDFLAGLGCKVRVSRIVSQEGPEYSRAYELLNKTNQFNTTGKRWTSSEIATFLRNGGAIFAFHVEDKFTKYGLVGVILFAAGHFQQFAMSCRVLGLDIETSVLNAIMNFVSDESVSEFSATVIETDANMVSRGVYERCGFAVARDQPQRLVRSRRDAMPVAAHLTLEGLEPAERADHDQDEDHLGTDQAHNAVPISGLIYSRLRRWTRRANPLHPA